MSTSKSFPTSPKRLAAVAAIALLPLAATPFGSGPADAASTARVKIAKLAYQPATLQVPRGTRVVFANKSNLPHTATREGSFDTGRIGPGKSAAVRFGRSGTFAYHCEIHPSMDGKIVVK
jgi:plastocyanin